MAKKQVIRLTESDLHRIVKESVNKLLRENSRRKSNMIKEGGHLYHKDEDGKVWTNSKSTYRGVPGSVYIWHGEWSDPEVLWDGVSLNANDIEDGLWYSYKDDCEERGETPTEQGYEDWLKEMGISYIASQLDDLAWAAQGCP